MPVFIKNRCGGGFTRVSAWVRGDGHPCFSSGVGRRSPEFQLGCGETVTRVLAQVWRDGTRVLARVRGDGHPCFSSGVGGRSPVFQLGCGETVTRVLARVRGDGHPCFSSGTGRRSLVS